MATVKQQSPMGLSLTELHQSIYLSSRYLWTGDRNLTSKSGTC